VTRRLCHAVVYADTAEGRYGYACERRRAHLGGHTATADGRPVTWPRRWRAAPAHLVPHGGRGPHASSPTPTTPTT
jgi:hypothetical protein